MSDNIFDGGPDDPILMQIAAEWGDPDFVHDSEWRAVVVDTILYQARKGDRQIRLLLTPEADRAARRLRRRMARMLPSVFGPEDEQ